MKKILIGGGIFALVAIMFMSSYNGMTQARTAVNQQLAYLDSALQSQSDVIPNMAEVAMGYAGHENKTLREVIEARKSLPAVAKVDPTTLNNQPELQKQVIEAQSRILNANQSALANIQSVQEQYPNLKADKQFSQLMVKLDSENGRVRVARDRAQDRIGEYNNKVQTLPGVLFASVMGFQPVPFFAAAESAKVAPKLDLKPRS